MILGRFGTGSHLALAGLAAVGIAATPQEAAPTDTRPNVVLILADDLGWADVGFHGAAIRTPNLDRLAREGLELERCYAQPTCTPARAALFSGRSPMRLGLAYAALRPWSNAGLDPAETILPAPFRAAGYQTWLVGKWHLGHDHRAHLPHSRGFDHFYGHLTGRVGYYDHARTGALDWQRNGTSVVEQGYATDLQAAEAARLVRERDPRRPFLLVLASSAPHRPLTAPPEGRGSASGDEVGPATYRAMVESLDRGVGRVLTALEEEGLAERTLVVFLSDNGGVEPSSNAPLRGGKGSVHEGGVRVPCVLRWPGVVPAGARDARPIGLEDWLPTLAGAAGVPLRPERPLDGVDRWSRLVGGSAGPAERPLFFAAERRDAVELAVLRWPWKLVRSLPAGGGTTAERLYDVAADPSESHDRAAEQADVRAALAAELDRWVALEPPGGLRLGAGRPHPGWIVPARWAEAVRD